MRRDPLIIGAGPAGTAAAIHLGRAGHHPMLIERSSGPIDKVCGDFLGADAMQHLAALGVDPLALGAAPIHRLRLVHRDRVTEVALPFTAVGLSRRVLDEALMRRAESAGAKLKLGHGVRHISRESNCWQIDTADHDPILADDIFLATGKHDLRAFSRPGVARGAVGMKMYFRLTARQTAALGGTIALILFPNGYAGLQCVEAERTVLCIAISQTRFRALGGTWGDLLGGLTAVSPLLAKMLAGAQPLLPRPLAVAGVPYGFLHRSSPDRNPSGPTFLSRLGTQRGSSPSAYGNHHSIDADRPSELFRLGDQAAVIPSLTGDGIAIALQSGTRAAQAWLRGEPASAYHHRLNHDLNGQMRLAGWLHKAALTGPLQAAAIRGAAWFPELLRLAARGTRLRTSIRAA